MNRNRSLDGPEGTHQITLTSWEIGSVVIRVVARTHSVELIRPSCTVVTSHCAPAGGVDFNVPEPSKTRKKT